MELKLLYLLSTLMVHTCQEMQPNFCFIVGDDIGWNDISLHGSKQIMTPNIDMIGLQGVVIQNYYTDSHGTASRSAMFTGKYPMRMGTQGESIGGAEDRGIPISEILLPSYLQELGYATHMVGKWQLGKSRECFLPTNRGFDTFYGFLGSSIDYYTYNYVESCNGSEFYGLDFFNNTKPVQVKRAEHLTYMLTDQAVKIIMDHDTSQPLYLHVAHAAAHIGGGLVNLQAPASSVTANDHIAHSARRSYAGMVTDVDRSVGEIMSALAAKEMLNNTIVVFVSDNGAPSTGPCRNFGSNLPLRGSKGSPWEGAVRSAAVLWHNDIKPQIWKGIFHVSDWMPTFIAAAGGNTSHRIDGFNQWDAMNGIEEPPRTETIIAVDDLNGWGALRDGDYKIIIGNVDECVSDYYGKELSKLRNDGPSYREALEDSETAAVFREALGMNLNLSKAIKKRHFCDIKKIIRKGDTAKSCIPTKEKGCLFNITADPVEANDLWYDKPEVVTQMSLRIRLLWSQITPRTPPCFDIRADPSNHGYIWLPWLADDVPFPASLMTTPPKCPMQVSTEEYEYYVDLNLKTLKEKLNNYAKSLTNAFCDRVSGYF